MQAFIEIFLLPFFFFLFSSLHPFNFKIMWFLKQLYTCGKFNQNFVVPVFQIRGGSRVKNLTATTTWPDTDENDNRLKYSYISKYYTLCDPPNCMTPCQKNYIDREYLESYTIYLFWLCRFRGELNLQQIQDGTLWLQPLLSIVTVCLKIKIKNTNPIIHMQILKQANYTWQIQESFCNVLTSINSRAQFLKARLS